MSRTYYAWCPENGDTESDAREVIGYDAENAAENWAEEDDSDSAEYSIANGVRVVVNVRDEAGRRQSARLRRVRADVLRV